MIHLIFIIILIIGIFKPDVLLAKQIKEKASEEQKTILTKNVRKISASIVATFESLALMRYTEFLGAILALVCIILLFPLSLPAIKENFKIAKELK